MNDSTVVPCLVGSQPGFGFKKDEAQAGFRIKQRIRHGNTNDPSTDNCNFVRGAHLLDSTLITSKPR